MTNYLHDEFISAWAYTPCKYFKLRPSFTQDSLGDVMYCRGWGRFAPFHLIILWPCSRQAYMYDLREGSYSIGGGYGVLRGGPKNILFILSYKKFESGIIIIIQSSFNFSRKWH